MLAGMPRGYFEGTIMQAKKTFGGGVGLGCKAMGAYGDKHHGCRDK